MQFQIGDDFTGGARRLMNLRRIQPGVAHRLRHADALRVGLRQPIVRPAAGQAATAEQRNAKARALFVAKADNLQRQRQTTPCSCSACTTSIAVSTPSMPS